MAITIKCACGKEIKVPEEHAGKTGKCPACGKLNKIPTLEQIEAFRNKKKAPDAAQRKRPSSAGRRRPSKPGVKKSGTKSGIRRPSSIGKKKSGRPSSREEREETRIRRPAKKFNPVPIAAGAGAVVIIAIIAYALMVGPDLEAAAQKYADYVAASETCTGEIINFCDGYLGDTLPARRTEYASKLKAVTDKWEDFQIQCDAWPAARDYSKSYEEISRAVSLVKETEHIVTTMIRLSNRENKNPYKQQVQMFKSKLQSALEQVKRARQRMERHEKNIRRGRV